MRKSAVLGALLGGIILFTGMAAATERHVPNEYPTIQDAINSSNDGDVIVVTDETYSSEESRNVDLVGKDIVIRGNNVNVPAASVPSATDPNAVHASVSPNRNYAPSEIIIKFKKPIGDRLGGKVLGVKHLANLKLSGSLDKLNQRYKLKGIKPLCKNFKQVMRRTEELLKKDESLLTKREKHTLARLKRAKKGEKIPDLDRIYKIELEEGQSAEQAVAEYKQNPDVEYAELNYTVSINLTPNDPLYPVQWPLNNTGQMYPDSGRYNTPPGTADSDIDSPEAWEIGTGDLDVIVAVVDTGVDYTHRDLSNNIWVNEAERNGISGIDDDNNGYIDDVYGYDFINYDSDPKDDHGHGTHCSGIISAEGNNGQDITGAAWRSRIMALKFLGADGSGYSTDAVTAFYYAVNNGADIVSNSWGGGGFLQSMQDAIDYAYSQGVIMVAAAGNSNSSQVSYPAYLEHVIAVAATNSKDERAPFSNYGDWVEIAAPGVDVLSLRATGTSMGTIYDEYTTIASGTSMACPHVAGACAVLLSVDPQTSPDATIRLLQQSADPIQSGICQSGRLNVYEMMLQRVFPRGIVRLYKEVYSCSSVLTVEVIDSDLKGLNTIDINVAADSGDLETVILSEEGTSTGVLRGNLAITAGSAVIGDGLLQTSDGQTITAEYRDMNDGSGNPATVTDEAVMDCRGAEVSDVNITVSPVGRSTTIKFHTDEPTAAQISCGLACGGPYNLIKSDAVISTQHTIKLSPLSSETNYYYVIRVTDEAGNETTADNNGICYSFTTPEFIGFLVPSVYSNIQAAVNDTWDGDTVWVADGIYKGEGNRDIDFYGKAITVRSENGPNNCIIDCNGMASEPHRGFNLHSQEPPSAFIDGFTIINGFSSNDGAAIYCQGFPWNGIEPRLTRPTIQNCIIYNCQGNSALCCNEHAFPTIINCTIKDNVGGNGIACYGTSGPKMINCVIVNNSTDGIYFDSCSSIPAPEISNCTITGNGGGIGAKFSNPEIINSLIANHKGSGVANEFGALTIANCIISNNHASGISYSQCKITLSDSIIVGNYSPDVGGGIKAVWDGGAVAENCVIMGNHAVQKGGGVWSNPNDEYADIRYTNCTIIDNECDNIGGGMSLGCYNKYVTNCIIWGNTAPHGSQIAVHCATSTTDVAYSDVEYGGAGVYFEYGGTLNWGPGNIYADPHFSLEGDYHIIENSPCIDAGTNSPAGGLPAKDIYGRVRNLDGDDNGSAIADMGAYEYEHDPTTPVIAISEPFFRFYNFQGQPNPDNQYLSLRNGGDGTLDWRISDDSFWLEAVPSRGTSSGDINEIALVVDTTTLSRGRYIGKLTITDSNALNSPREILVTLDVAATIHVPEQYLTIQEAIDAAGDGSTIVVADGIYTGTGNRNISFKGRAITVQSKNGPEYCIVDCKHSGRGFIFDTCEGQDSVLDGFTIKNGYSTDFGGGIYCGSSGPVISNCRISNCNSTAYGGGAYCATGNPVISNCLFENNLSTTEGGGIYLEDATPALIEDSIFINNAAQNGGGIGTRNDENDYKATIRNCLLYGNTAFNYGGGIYYSSSRSIISNCTITRNSAVDGGGLYVDSVYSQIPTVNNSIFWADSTNEIVYTGVGTPAITYCDIAGGWPGTGNISADPCFVTVPQGDCYLSQTAAGQAVDSPCVNSGSDTAVNLGMDTFTTRTDGTKDRGVVDMGYHYSAAILPADIYKDWYVDFLDFAILAADWLKCNDQSDSNCTGGLLAGDIFQDNYVNLYDIATFADNWLDCLVEAASSPSPSNGARGKELNATLMWAAGGGALEHDVYLGTDANAVAGANHLSEEFIGTVSDVSFDTYSLDGNTTYFWRIDETGPRCTTKGNVWNFTTKQGEEEIDPNLAGWWKLDDSSGTAAYDSAGDNNGILVNGPVWTTGQIDGALSFDGVDDYVDLGNSSSLKLPLPVTISAWIKLDAVEAEQGLVCLDAQQVNEQGVSTFYGIWFIIHNDRLMTNYGSGANGFGGRRSKTGTTAFMADRWYHVAAVLRGPTDMDLYIDAVNDGGSYSGVGGELTYSNGNSHIGYYGGTTLNYFKGVMDDVRVYDRALSAEEILQIYGEGL